jgi:hypothetical protein
MALGGLVLPVTRLAAKPPAEFDLDTVCDRMVERDRWRADTLMAYSVTRRYTFSSSHSSQPAEMLVQMEYTRPGRKTFRVLSQKNCGFLPEIVFRDAMNAEIEASRDDIRDSIRITPQNYEFEALGTGELGGRSAYIMRVKPRRRQRFVVDGRVWVDMNDAAVAHIEGKAATSSLWVRSFRLVESYARFGPYWLVISIRNDASVRFWGDACLQIDDFDYKLQPAA